MAFDDGDSTTRKIHIFPDEDNSDFYRVSPSGANATVERTGSVSFNPTGSKVTITFPAGSPLAGNDVTIDAGASVAMLIPPAAALGAFGYKVFVFAISGEAKTHQDNDPELIIEQLSS